METVETDKINFRELGVPEHLIEQVKADLEGYVTAAEKERLEHVSPPGALGVCPLLEQKRLAWLIPDLAIEAGRGCLFDYILIHQIPNLAKDPKDKDATHFGGGLLMKPTESKENESRTAPRGVIVGAGLGALDSMRSHGIDIGHTVKFLKTTVHRLQVDMIAEKWEWISVCHIHDLLTSEELATNLRSSRAWVVADESGRHSYCDETVGARPAIAPVDDESM